MEHDSGKKRKLSSKEEDGVKDILLRQFKEVASGSVFNNLEEHGSITRKEKTTFAKVQCKIQQGAVTARKVLSFGCSICDDELNYSPNDLLKHFEVTHKGVLPTYPCDLCEYVTNEFPDLQRHRLEHRNTLVTCELCNNGVQYSLLMLTRHYLVSHSLNGQFFCDWCKFSTVDAGTFVQHIHHHNERPWKCSKCGNIDLNEEDHKKHMKAHNEIFPCTCQFCGYGTMRSDHLKRHMVAVHRKEMYVKGTVDDTADHLNPSTTTRNLLKKTSDSQEHQQVSKWNLLSENLPNHNGRLIRRELAMEENHKSNNQKKDTRKRDKISNTASQSRQIVLRERDQQASLDAGIKVVRLKNKISLPPNCTTKVLGFKMVDGKKHLVLRVVSKPEICSNGTSSVEGVIPSTPKSSMCKSDTLLENGECSDSGPSLGTHSFAVSPKECSSLFAEDEIMAVKVKTEEEEIMVCNFDSNTHFVEGFNSPNGSKSQKSEILHQKKNEFGKGTSAVYTDPSAAITSGSEDPSNPISIRKNVYCENGRDLSVTSCTTQLKTERSPEAADLIRTELDNKSTPILITQQSTSSNSLHYKEGTSGSVDMSDISPEVFSFHNYSKESITNNQYLDKMSPHSSPFHEKDEGASSLTESQSSLNGKPTVCDEDDGQCEEVFLEDGFEDFNIIKIEEDTIPICDKDFDSNTSLTSLVDFVKQNSNEIISAQLSKESATCSNESSKQTKTTLRILQLPEGNRPMLMRTTENRFAMPVKVNSSPGFKLLTNSANPQINISYMKPGLKQATDSSEGTSNPDKRLGSWTSKVKAVEKVKPQKGTSSNHYLIKSSGLKGQVILSNASQTNLTDKSAMTQKTCFLLQSSLPLVQTQNNSGLRLASNQHGNSGQVLAMPVSPADKHGNTKTGRQRFLLRYISPSKSGEQLNQESNSGPQCSKTSEANANKVIYKLVKPAGSLLKSVSTTTNGEPVLLANRPQTKCFFLANKVNPKVNSTLKQIMTMQKPDDHNNTQESVISPPRLLVKLKPCETEKPLLAPRSIRPPSQRKRHRKTIFDEPPHTVHKSRRLANKVLLEKDTAVSWKPTAKDVERTLRLSPFLPIQNLKYPGRYQPVVVLNHPDADIPEVVNIMRLVSQHKGAVTAVSLCKKTVQALAEHHAFEKASQKGSVSQRNAPAPRTVQSCVRERFILKMKLRKKSKKKYAVVDTLSEGSKKQMTFECWFCGRLFNNQEDWIGHGQRHLMEATRDWNILF